MFNRKKEPLMTFLTNVPGLAEDPLCQPQPAMKFVPDAWKKVPRSSPIGEFPLSIQKRRTIKTCPSFVDWFTTGVILPAWCDMAFKYDKTTDKWEAAMGAGTSPYDIKAHPHDQMLKYMDYKHRGEQAQLVFKLVSPWALTTPKGYSTLQLPLFYHADRDWQVMAGMWDSDLSITLDLQVAYFGNGQEVLIKKGQPLVHYIPFKREKINFITKLMNDKDLYKLNSNAVAVASKAGGGWAAIPREEN
jgi:hypothetical protein